MTESDDTSWNTFYCIDPDHSVRIKALGSGKGNTADANVGRWSHTVRRVKATYTAAQWVIPGHGKAGGSELLDYTEKLFSENAVPVE